MRIIYATRTGNVALFARRLIWPTQKLTENLHVNEPFVLVTYTDKFGEAPGIVRRFLRDNSEYMRGVAASGNRNFGRGFAGAADEIAREYGVPVLLKFELAGTPSDIQKFNEEVTRLDENLSLH
ncbi:class Ib ribonucleoside-diphosphate reductase assembly flavoprotein NrdI [Paenibacillus sp. VCA1]|uniref:class Ib ribonucleoside-diphosphate reductase assembly flavoprotein NrdI n=1 Tax=Paenibacillus sp. VCA1 TaxID=3039148 RepID=UPI0028728DDE|nr:class Ib ribonucleoside-diphosphate reductase assembly flavoprotein NrdI [Paenibacillus sp. VCA1]MDR9852935.1 class Ib ribonucleoside-diphosphate reductase assembly flavoprotein NrdI [Paenibacillus sp. VCA1]